MTDARYQFPFPPGAPDTQNWNPAVGEWGVDFGTQSGSPIHAPFSGTVVLAEPGPCGAGWGLRFGVAGGPQGETVLFGHMRDQVAPSGSQVCVGQLIGHSGGGGLTDVAGGCRCPVGCTDPNCGCTTGSHIEFQLMPHGGSGHALPAFVDPRPYLSFLHANATAYGSGSSCGPPPDPHPECTNEGAHWVIPGLSGQPGGSCSCNETTPCWSGQDSTRGIPGTGPCVALPPGHVVRRFRSGNPTGDCPTPGELSPDGSGETWFLLLLAAAAAGGYALHRGHHLPHALRREEDWVRNEAGRAERWTQREAASVERWARRHRGL